MKHAELTHELEMKNNLRLKRLFDFSFAILGFIVLLPLFLLIALLVKLSSKGPVFFRQKRLTIGAKHFEILKFLLSILSLP